MGSTLAVDRAYGMRYLGWWIRNVLVVHTAAWQRGRHLQGARITWMAMTAVKDNAVLLQICRCGYRTAPAAQVFLGSLLLLLCLAWLPVYLAYYPGICAYDAPVQTGQIVEHYYFDHHPIVHTSAFTGNAVAGNAAVFGSVNAGMALLHGCCRCCCWRAAWPMVCWYCTDGRLAAGLAARDAVTWNVFPVSLVYECQHDQGYGVQCIFVVAAGESDGSSYGGPQEYGVPGSGICCLESEPWE